MDDLELKGIVSRMQRDATGYVSSEITQERNQNLEYYLGEPFGNEVEGRSQVISRDVMDVVEWILPSIMATFHGSEKPVEFSPVGPEDEAYADQATDYINYVYTVDNPGFMITHAWVKDALIQKVGFVKHYAEEQTSYTTERYEGLSEDEVALLLSDEALEVVSQDEQTIVTPVIVDLEGREVEDVEVTLTNLEVRRAKTWMKTCVVNVPPEEFSIERGARSLEDARFMAHQTQKTRTQLIEAGYDADLINGLAAWVQDERETEEEDTRHNKEEFGEDRPEGADKSTDLIDILEAIVYVDYDGDGIAERRRVVIANDNVLLENEEFDDPLFTDFCTIPMPHTVWGLAVADLLRDVQIIKSSIMRTALDSLNLSIDPEKIVDVNKVGDYMEDFLSPKVPGKLYRQNAPGGIEFRERPWGGDKAFAMLDYMDRVREGRTGVSQVTAGMNPDMLKGNVTRDAFNQTLTAAQQRVELIMRIFAETAFKKLMRNLLKLVTKYQDEERVIRLRNEFVPIDPRGWNAEMDVTVNVGLGTNNKEQQMGSLMTIAQFQKEALLHPEGRRMVTLDHIYNTYEQMTKTAGYPSVDPFFRDPSSPEAMQETQQAGGQPDPMAMQLQLAAKAQEAELALKREEMLRKDDRERDKMEAEIKLQAIELQAKYGVQVDMANIRADMERDREVIRQQAAMRQAAMQPRPPMGAQNVA